MSGVVLSEKRARVHWITINRPERQNALDRETILALRDQMTANMALQNLKHVTPLITEISKVIPILVAQDVHDDVETADVSVAQQAIRNTQEAWDAKNVNQMSSSNAYAMAN